jgi:hypothetical protein
VWRKCEFDYTLATMLKISRWKLVFAAGLVLLAMLLFGVQLIVFSAPRQTFFYLLQDVAFLPISVLVVTVILAEVLEWRERSGQLHKLNMVMGAFFSEMGYELMRHLLSFDPDHVELSAAVHPQADWDKARFAAARQQLMTRQLSCDAGRGDLVALAALLHGHRSFLLSLVENPALLEHETFSELIWAVLHVDDELVTHGSAGAVSAGDLRHLGADSGRAYRMLVRQWLSYMEHLSRSYPYLYSLAVRTSPLAQAAGAAAGPAA